MLYLLTFRFFEGQSCPTTFTYIIESKLNLLEEEQEVLYNFIHTTSDDMYDPQECEIVVLEGEVHTLAEKDKETILKEIYMETAENIMDALELPETEEKSVKEWVCSLNVSLEELRDTMGIAGSYESRLVEATPLKELPLLIGHLKTEKAIKLLEERLKG